MSSAVSDIERLQSMADTCLRVFGKKLKVRVLVREHEFFEQGGPVPPAFYRHPNVWIRPEFIRRAKFSDIVKLLRRMLTIAVVSVSRSGLRIPYGCEEGLLKSIRGMRLIIRNGLAAYRAARRRFYELRQGLKENVRASLFEIVRKRFVLEPLRSLRSDELSDAFGHYWCYTGDFPG